MSNHCLVSDVCIYIMLRVHSMQTCQYPIYTDQRFDWWQLNIVMSSDTAPATIVRLWSVSSFQLTCQIVYLVSQLAFELGPRRFTCDLINSPERHCVSLRRFSIRNVRWATASPREESTNCAISVAFTRHQLDARWLGPAPLVTLCVYSSSVAGTIYSDQWTTAKNTHNTNSAPFKMGEKLRKFIAHGLLTCQRSIASPNRISDSKQDVLRCCV